MLLLADTSSYHPAGRKLCRWTGKVTGMEHGTWTMQNAREHFARGPPVSDFE